MVTVVTNCTARKKKIGAPIFFDRKFVSNDVAGTIANWKRALEVPRSVRASAQDVYVGRSVREAKRAAQTLDASLLFVSAGLGLVAAETQIPCYDATPSVRRGPLAQTIQQLDATAATWWSALSKNALSSIINSNKREHFLIALPASYLHLVHDDLECVTPGAVRRLRIFTSGAGTKVLPAHLRQCALPYDDRLESIKRYGGTKTDFAQRALSHFVHELKGCSVALVESHELVNRSLRNRPKPIRPSRKTQTDAEILRLLRKHWRSCDGRSSKLLRALRDTELVACEQKRLFSLCNQILKSRCSK